MKTIGDLITAVLKIDNEHDMRAFVEEYLRLLQGKNVADPVKVMQENIGYCFGEGMSQERIDQWHKVCGASHWIMGTKLPDSFEDALHMGMEYMKKSSTLCG